MTPKSWVSHRVVHKMKPTDDQPIVSSASPHHRHTRFTSHEKTDAVLRLLKGESVEAVSEALGVSIGRLERWKSSFVAAGSAELARRKDVAPSSWITRHVGSIRQWVWLLVALIGVIVLLAVFMQRGPAE
jgi:hypothetical protein